MAKPAPDLAGRVEKCWVASCGEEKGRHFFEILPEPSMNLILRASPSGSRLVLHGARTEKFCVELDLSATYVCVSFNPGQALRVADVKSAEVVDRLYDMSSLGGMSVDELAERILSLPDPRSQQRLMESLVRGAAPMMTEQRFRYATSMINDSRGRIQVTDLAGEVGVTVRTLERLFFSSLGVTPKQHIRLVRFGQLSSALRQLRPGDLCSSGIDGDYYSAIGPDLAATNGNLSDLAYLFGYADQSHMIRDFKSLSGRLPNEAGAAEMRRLEGIPRMRLVHRYRT